jgi:type I restriction enzyme M protein
MPRLSPSPLNTRQPFADALVEFDRRLTGQDQLTRSFVPVNGQTRTGIRLRDSAGQPLEEYYKWQFLYALINSGLYSKDYIGAEIWFPKGNKGANALQIDAAIFDDAGWIERYQAYWRDREPEDLHWLGEHLLAVIEFKRDEREIDQVFTRQIKPAMREKEPSDAYVLGMFYDAGRLLMFHRRNGKYLRYDESLNQKGDDSQVGDLNLQYQDPYSFIPSFNELQKLVNRPALVDRSKRSIDDLEVIRSRTSLK